MSGSPSGTKRPSMPPQTLPSSSEHAKLDLPPDRMSAIVDAMCEESDLLGWSTLLKNAGDNPQAIRNLMTAVLMCLTQVLSNNGIRRFGPETADADYFSGDFSEGELEEWKTGLRNGVDMGKWGDLVTYRTYHPIPNGRMAFRIFISKVDRYHFDSDSSP